MVVGTASFSCEKLREEKKQKGLKDKTWLVVIRDNVYSNSFLKGFI